MFSQIKQGKTFDVIHQIDLSNLTVDTEWQICDIFINIEKNYKK